MDKKPHQPNPSQYTIFDTDLKQPLSIMDVPPSYSQFSPQQQRSLPIREEQHHSPRGELPHSNYHPAYPQQHQPIIERSQNNRKRSRQQSNPSSGQQNSLTSQQDNKPMPEAVVYAPCAQCKGRYDGVECWQAWQFAGAEWQFSVPANIAWLANEGARTDRDQVTKFKRYLASSKTPCIELRAANFCDKKQYGHLADGSPTRRLLRVGRLSYNDLIKWLEGAHCAVHDGDGGGGSGTLVISVSED